MLPLIYLYISQVSKRVSAPREMVLDWEEHTLCMNTVSLPHPSMISLAPTQLVKCKQGPTPGDFDASSI